MKCANPYMYEGSIPFGCGQCMSCRKNKLRLWQHRLMLEGMKHQESCMVTLTYADQFLPPNGSLSKTDYQLFLKKLRRQFEPLKIRYYLVGEYGERNLRPHYHIALFGIGKSSHHIIESCWGKGHIDTGYEGEVGKINKDSAQYICGYITKKLTSRNDPKVIEKLTALGKIPEFARMSLKPGIGASVVDDIVNFLTTNQGCEALLRTGDVPMVLNHGKCNSYPLGRYLRRLIREKMGFPETGAQEGWKEKAKIRAQEEMLELCIREGVLGLIKKDEEDEDTKIIKKLYPSGEWKKMLLQKRNIALNEQLEVKENQNKFKGRKL